MNKEVIGNYTLYKKHKLGKGSFSSVYRGIYNGKTTDKISSGDFVGIKVINIYGLHKKDLDMINNEISIMNMLKNNGHPNVIKCVETIKTQKSAYIIMELCDCGDLSLIMTKAIKEKYARLYFIQLIDGLKFLHSYNFIHRDIKPKNILLTNNRKILKIADFGFAKIVKEKLMKEKMCGSPLYMAPEIMNNDVYNDQSDLWSVGLILYEMLYNTHPYESCKSLDELKGVVNTTTIKIPPENSEVRDISSECLELLNNILQKNIDKRITWDDFFNNNWTNNEKYDIDMINNDTIDDDIYYNNTPINNSPVINRTISKNMIINNKSSNIKIPRSKSFNSYESGMSYNTPDGVIKVINTNINIVENYYTIEDNSPSVKVNNYITDSGIFDMDFGDDNQIKK
jgi:serine/threonine-protein kinase ULK/ATG1